MTAISVDRRSMIAGAASTGVLLLSGRIQFARASQQSVSAVTAWIRISDSGAVTLIASQSEMGQGTTATLARALADELYLALEDVNIEFAPFAADYRDPVFNWMFTGNSQGISSFYDAMRRMGAAAREMLVAAAAMQLMVPADELTLAKGRIFVRGTTRSIGFGEVAASAAGIPVPTKPTPRDDGSAGRATARWDIPGKVDGSAVFGIDVQLPDMLLAAVRCAPRFGATLTRYDGAALKAKPGVVAVVEIPNGLAVVARTYWQAHAALEKAELTWSDDGATLTSGRGLPAAYAAGLASGPFFTHKAVGDAAKTAAGTARQLEAQYRVPFQAHATMEPMNCTVRVTNEQCEIWAPTQGVELTQQVASQVTGLPSEKIIVRRTFLGGGFGRRLLADFVKQALIVGMAVRKPVKLIWSREEDVTHDAYRPAVLHEISGALSESGEVTALAHRVVAPSHMLYIFPRSMFPNMKDWTAPVAPPEKFDAMGVEGLVEIPYAIPNQSVKQHRLDLGVPVSVWRTTGHGANNFGLECFIDELAALAKTDPLTFRRRLLGQNPRAMKVLDTAAERSGWTKTMPAGHGRGIALAAAFGGLIASVVELSAADGRLKIHRIVAAVDCGRTLDPGIAESNILGGIVWGLSAMRTEITFKGGAAMQSNFDAFEPLHLWETPPCEVHFVENGGKLGGTGELGPVPIPAAVCNAIFAAIGRRVRTLPLSASGLSFA